MTSAIVKYLGVVAVIPTMEGIANMNMIVALLYRAI